MSSTSPATIRNSLIVEAVDELACNLVIATHDDVIANTRWQLARRTQVELRLEPGRVEEPDEHERQHDHQQHDPGEQHEDAEDASGIRVERDVAEPERAHHRERPIETRDPRVPLALEQHHAVEGDRIGADDRRQEDQVLE
ncbi:MAG: hypothetical protein JRG80_17335 [Deltaproteobacteria bacterium]|nr:hypothetical protein [Deltaproteobacteria bacterium]